MSEEITDKPFREASDKVEAEVQKGIEDVKSRVESAKSAALKKVAGQ
jgi:uncharacterized protein YjbJ (UPF0337 family)